MSLLIQRAVNGERIVIDLHGLPAVVLVPVASERVMMDAFLVGQDRDIQATGGMGRRGSTQ